MKKRTMHLLASLLIVCLLMCACSAERTPIPEEQKQFDTMYELTELSSSNWVYVDPENDVMYCYIGHGYGGGLTAMLNKDATPKLYDEASSMYDVTFIDSRNWVYVDSETNVMYWYVGHGYGGGLTIMLEPDGSPKLYDEATSIYDVTFIDSKNWVYVDSETKVMYWYVGHGYGGGLSIMLEADGSPKLYDEANSIYDVTEIASRNWVYVDIESRVMYWYVGHGYGGGLDIMLESDGFPKLYDKENSIYDVTEISSRNWVYIDPENNVMYWYVGHGYGGGLATMLERRGNSKVAK